MIGGFSAVVYYGHLPLFILVVVIQSIIFKEILALGLVKAKEKQLPYFRTLQWFFLLTTLNALYLKQFLLLFEKSIHDTFLWNFVTYHTFITFSCYCLGILGFVLSLKAPTFRYQFGMFAWTHMILLLVPIQASFLITNIMNGIYWFLLPVSMVICNDITAYIFGFFFGRNRLIKLSPKKTWEGFIGGSISTVMWSFAFAGWLSQFSWMVCPRFDFTEEFLPCSPHAVFIPQVYTPPPEMASWLRWMGFTFTGILVAPVQWHAIAIGLFASVVAPFGGFFASGFKRAFGIKDFGESIPGHGGLTDRFDCQLLMGVFMYVYYITFIRRRMPVPEYLLTNISVLDDEDQIALFEALKASLQHRGLLPHP